MSFDSVNIQRYTQEYSHSNNVSKTTFGWVIGVSVIILLIISIAGLILAIISNINIKNLPSTETNTIKHVTLDHSTSNITVYPLIIGSIPVSTFSLNNLISVTTYFYDNEAGEYIFSYKGVAFDTKLSINDTQYQFSISTQENFTLNGIFYISVLYDTKSSSSKSNNNIVYKKSIPSNKSSISSIISKLREKRNKKLNTIIQPSEEEFNTVKSPENISIKSPEFNHEIWD